MRKSGIVILVTVGIATNMAARVESQENPVSAQTQTLRITGLEISENSAHMQVMSTGHFEWTQCQFLSQKVFPNPFFPEGEGNRHRLAIGQPESQTFEWLQSDFIIIGDFEIIDPNTIELYPSISGGDKLTAVWDPESKTIELDGLKYDTYVNPSGFILSTSDDLKEWTDKPLPGLTPSLIPLGDSFSLTQPLEIFEGGGSGFFTIRTRP